MNPMPAHFTSFLDTLSDNENVITFCEWKIRNENTTIAFLSILFPSIISATVLRKVWIFERKSWMHSTFILYSRIYFILVDLNPRFLNFDDFKIKNNNNIKLVLVSRCRRNYWQTFKALVFKIADCTTGLANRISIIKLVVCSINHVARMIFSYRSASATKPFKLERKCINA